MKNVQCGRAPSNAGVAANAFPAPCKEQGGELARPNTTSDGATEPGNRRITSLPNLRAALFVAAFMVPA